VIINYNKKKPRRIKAPKEEGGEGGEEAAEA